MNKANRSLIIQLLPLISGALLLFGVLGLVLLSFFGIMIMIDSYAFAISPLISDARIQKGASCFIAAGYHGILILMGVCGFVASRMFNK